MRRAHLVPQGGLHQDDCACKLCQPFLAIVLSSSFHSSLHPPQRICVLEKGSRQQWILGFGDAVQPRFYLGLYHRPQDHLTSWSQGQLNAVLVLNTRGHWPHTLPSPFLGIGTPLGGWAKDGNFRYGCSFGPTQRYKLRSRNPGNREIPQVLPPASLSPSENLKVGRELESLSLVPSAGTQGTALMVVSSHSVFV